MSIETERLILRPFTESDAPSDAPVPLRWNAARIPT